jgi:hypothetical protein
VTPGSFSGGGGGGGLPESLGICGSHSSGYGDFIMWNILLFMSQHRISQKTLVMFKLLTIFTARMMNNFT